MSEWLCMQGIQKYKVPVDAEELGGSSYGRCTLRKCETCGFNPIVWMDRTKQIRRDGLTPDENGRLRLVIKRKENDDDENV